MELCDKEIHLLTPIFKYNIVRTSSNFKSKHNHDTLFPFLHVLQLTFNLKAFPDKEKTFSGFN